MSVTVNRIEKEIKSYQELQDRIAFLSTDSSDPYNYVIKLLFSNFAVAVKACHPRDYPFSPPSFVLLPSECENLSRVIDQFQLVCPELIKFGDLRKKISSNPFPKLTLFCPDNWSPALTVPPILEKAHRRLSCWSFPEALDLMMAHVPTTTQASSVNSIARFLFGTASEAPPGPSQNQEIVVLMDPQWSSSSTSGWTTWRNGNSTYICLAAPYCHWDDSSQCAMVCLVDTLRERGWSTILCYSTILIEMPETTGLSMQGGYYNKSATWDKVPLELNREIDFHFT